MPPGFYFGLQCLILLLFDFRDLFESYSPLSLQKDMVRVEMMTNMEKVEYSHSRDAQVLGLPYQGKFMFGIVGIQEQSIIII